VTPAARGPWDVWNTERSGNERRMAAGLERSPEGTRLRLALGGYLGIGRSVDGSGKPVLTLEGELDLYGAPEIEKALEAIGPDVAEVIVDVRGLTFVDSSGIRSLLQGGKARRARGGRLVCIARRGGKVREMLDLTGAEAVLDIRDGYLPDA